MEFAVVGGDMRIVKLAELLALDGHTVRAFGLERGESGVLARSETLRGALEGARYVILPIPVLTGDEFRISSGIARGLSNQQIIDQNFPEVTNE